MRSFSNSVTLFKASLRVLQEDKELLVYPVLSSIAMVLVTASFGVPIWLSGSWEMLEDGSGSYLGMAITFAFYLIQYFIAFFFNTALVGAALVRLRGGDPTVSTGLNMAIERLPTIIGYAALSSTVGMILQTVAERSGGLGRFVSGLIGMGWRLATFLAIPVMVDRNTGTIDTVKESASLFKKTWGEQVISNFGFGWIGFLAAVSWGISMVLGMILLGPLGPYGVFPILAIGVLGFLMLGLVLSALKGIYTAALYQYATEGHTDFFDDEIVESAFRQK